MTFYTYIHLKPNNEVFYVGKGHGRRWLDCWRGRNRHWKYIVEKYKWDNIKKVIVENFADEREAFQAEIELIAEYRSLGCKLTNTTIGGEGPSGLKHSEENKRIVSEKLKGRIVSDATRQKLRESKMGDKNPMFGKKQSSEFIEKRVEMLRGRKYGPISNEKRLKLRAAKLGRTIGPSAALKSWETRRKKLQTS